MNLLLSLLLFLFFAAPSAVAQTADPASILARVDAVTSKAADITAEVELETVEPDGKVTKRSFTVWQKGSALRMLKLTKPARLKGVGMLATNADELHMYLPSFGRVRRVAGRKRGAPFLGSNFTQDDMVRTTYGTRFVPALLGENESEWTLRLDPKKPGDEPYHHLVIKVRKKDALVSAIEFFESKGAAPSRRLLASEFREVQSIPFAHRIEALDLGNNSRSTATMRGIKVDTGLEADFFTPRHLKRK